MMADKLADMKEMGYLSEIDGVEEVVETGCGRRW